MLRRVSETARITKLRVIQRSIVEVLITHLFDEETVRRTHAMHIYGVPHTITTDDSQHGCIWAVAWFLFSFSWRIHPSMSWTIMRWLRASETATPRRSWRGLWPRSILQEGRQKVNCLPVQGHLQVLRRSLWPHSLLQETNWIYQQNQWIRLAKQQHKGSMFTNIS